jgi:hypothetical protein
MSGVEKHFKDEAAEPQVPPLRFPGFPVENRGVGIFRAALFKENRIRGHRQQFEVGNPGYAPVGMTKGRAMLPRGEDAEQKPPFITFNGTRITLYGRPDESLSRPARTGPRRDNRRGQRLRRASAHEPYRASRSCNHGTIHCN